MNSKKYRKIQRYKNYFDDFFDKQTVKVQQKIIWTLELIEDIEHVPEIYLKRLSGTSGLYELRVKLTSNIYRIFCFFYKGDLVVLMNGFQKKSRKTPKREITKAIKIKKEYEKEKD